MEHQENDHVVRQQTVTPPSKWVAAFVVVLVLLFGIVLSMLVFQLRILDRHTQDMRENVQSLNTQLVTLENVSPVSDDAVGAETDTAVDGEAIVYPFGTVRTDVEREVENYEGATHFSAQEFQTGTCERMTEFDVDAELRTFDGLLPGALETETLQAWAVEQFGEQSGPAVLEEMARKFTRSGDVGATQALHSVCFGERETHAVTYGGEYYYAYQIRFIQDDPEHPRLEPYQPIYGSFLGASVGSISDGEGIILHGAYGDVGFVDWRVYRWDTESRAADLIERCATGPFEEEDELLLRCSREFIPSSE